MSTDVTEQYPNSVIESVGVYLPPKSVSSADLIDACKNKVLFPLERLTGIKFRRMAGDVEFSIDLAEQAIRKCMNASQYRPEDIDLLICCNISRHDGPDFHFSFEPSTSIRLKHKFGFHNAISFDISNACAGMFTGFTLADAFLKAGMVRTALVVSGEYITHLTRTALKEIQDKSDSRIPCLTLGDSGAAVILEQAPTNEVGFKDIEMYTLGTYSELCIAKPTDQEHGGAIMLTESVKLHAEAIKSSVLHVVGVLKQQEKPKNGNLFMIMHQTARTAIAETARQINGLLNIELFHRDNMINNLEERGNTSSTSHIVAIWDNILSNKLQDGDNVLFAVQASGITVGTAPYTFDDLPSRLRRAELQGLPTAKRAATAPVRPKSTKRVRIESIGTIPESSTALTRSDAFELASVAAEDCLAQSRYSRDEIDILMHAGVHRNEFICEPAVAALVAGRVNCNGAIQVHEAENKTFAFDVFNGAIGFFNACYNSVAMLHSGRYRNVMVVASEIENNTHYDRHELLGIKETGSAMILDQDGDDDSGFGAFSFRYFTDHIESFTSYIGQDKGQNFLSFERDANLQQQYLSCITTAVKDVLEREGLTMDQIRTIFPPQISSEFITRLSDRLNVARNRFVDLALDGKDYFTSSLPYSMQWARQSGHVKSGDVGLIVNVGTGIQVGCALYHF